MATGSLSVLEKASERFSLHNLSVSLPRTMPKNQSESTGLWVGWVGSPGW